ncbi:MAG: transposase [Deltaproteobacteria bacterium]|nr:transposase [Deltaproteobacteria bacterium]MBW2396753.1 transposase [Deltaproteobacteria bacterium]
MGSLAPPGSRLRSARCGRPEARSYERHRPEESVLYAVVQAELETFLARAHLRGHPVPRFIEREFRAYLRCGVLAHGFLRLHCDGCGHDRLVPFSCKGRFCPSCAGRRMADTAAHLVDRVLPVVPVRQWVLSLPFPLRYRVAYDARLTGEILNLFLRTLFASLRRRARKKWGVRSGQSGAVTFVQRFGSAAANLHPHFHTLALDGVYQIQRNGPPRFHPLPPPDSEEVAQVATATARRVARLLETRGLGAEADPDESDPLGRDEPLLASLAAASLRGHIATGPHAGQRLLRLGDRALPEECAASGARSEPSCANQDGFSLHATVAVPARDRRRLERLCRYVARPPLATERLTKQDDGRLRYRLKRRWRDGTTHIVLKPAALLERLALSIPPPRFHLVRYHGILAPCASWRDHVVPGGPGPAVADRSGAPRVEPEGGCAPAIRDAHRPQGDPRDESVGRIVSPESQRPPSAEGSPTTLRDDPTQIDPPTPVAGSPSPAPCRQRRLSWGELLRRVFAVDAFACPRCGSRMRLIATIESEEVIRAILGCLGLPARAPPLAPARSEPATGDLDFGNLPIIQR